VRASGGLALLGLGSSDLAEARRGAQTPGAASGARRQTRGAESQGRRAAPSTDAPGGALAPEGVSHPQIEQLGDGRASREPGTVLRWAGGRAGRALALPGLPRRGWQRGGEFPTVALPAPPSPGPGTPRALPSGLSRAGLGGAREREEGESAALRSSSGRRHFLDPLLQVLPPSLYCLGGHSIPQTP
jgi:hypothetical protein